MEKKITNAHISKLKNAVNYKNSQMRQYLKSFFFFKLIFLWNKKYAS